MSVSNAIAQSTVESATCPFKKPFISYARRDSKFAQRLAGDLRARGAVVWIDEEGIRAGDQWEDKIEDALRECAEVILVVSSAAKRSAYVKKELSFARRLDRPITPVLYGWCLPWLAINDLQHVDFRDWYDEGLAKLMHSKPPRRTFWRQVLIFLNRLRIILPAIALLAGILAYAYNSTPSNTTFTISGGDASKFVVLVRNQGGRPSTLIGGSFRLQFGKLPIESQPLLVSESETVRIPGHSNDTIVHLTMPAPYAKFRPKERAPNSYFNKKSIEPYVSTAAITLNALVEESGGRLRHREADGRNRINTFVINNFPDDVSTTTYQ